MLGGEDYYDWKVKRVEGMSKVEVFALLDVFACFLFIAYEEYLTTFTLMGPLLGFLGANSEDRYLLVLYACYLVVVTVARAVFLNLVAFSGACVAYAGLLVFEPITLFFVVNLYFLLVADLHRQRQEKSFSVSN